MPLPSLRPVARTHQWWKVFLEQEHTESCSANPVHSASYFTKPQQRKKAGTKPGNGSMVEKGFLYSGKTLEPMFLTEMLRW